MAAFKINDPEMDEWVSKFKDYPDKRADWEARSFGDLEELKAELKQHKTESLRLFKEWRKEYKTCLKHIGKRNEKLQQMLDATQRWYGKVSEAHKHTLERREQWSRIQRSVSEIFDEDVRRKRKFSGKARKIIKDHDELGEAMEQCDSDLARAAEDQAQLLAKIQAFKTYAVNWEDANLVPADDHDDGSDDDGGEGGANSSLNANRPPLEIDDEFDDDDHDDDEEEEEEDDDVE